MNDMLPRPKGPPLNALRAFEAAARLSSFKLAANELCVTAGAIAQHIKALEAWTQSPLFTRHAQGVELTDLGRDILPKFIAAFDSLGDAIHSLRTVATPNQIRIAALPSVAQLWLSPRLPLIREEFPEISISITALETPPNMTRDAYDISLFFQRDAVKEGQLDLGQDVFYPVCSPALAINIKGMEDIPSNNLLHDLVWQDDWQKWSLAYHPLAIQQLHGPVYSLYSLALEEAIQGAGLLIGHDHLVKHHIHSGRLIAPFKERLAGQSRLVLSTTMQAKDNTMLASLVAYLSRAS